MTNQKASDACRQRVEHLGPEGNDLPELQPVGLVTGRNFDQRVLCLQGPLAPGHLHLDASFNISNDKKVSNCAGQLVVTAGALRQALACWLNEQHIDLMSRSTKKWRQYLIALLCAFLWRAHWCRRTQGRAHARFHTDMPLPAPLIGRRNPLDEARKLAPKR